MHSCLAFVHSCLADKKFGRYHKISGSPVAGPVFRYSTGKTGRVGKYDVEMVSFSMCVWVCVCARICMCS